MMSVPNEAMTDAFRLAEQQNTMLRQMLADRAKRKQISLTVDDAVLTEIEKLTGELSVEETARTIRHALFQAREAAFKRHQAVVEVCAEQERLGLE